MFQYVLALLLINTYYQSAAAPNRSGNPATPHVSDSLASLASKCENAFIADQINRKIEECKLPGDPPYNKQKLQCLMFFDINKQLCSVLASLKLPLAEDLAAKIKEKQDINTFCTLTNNWVFTNLTEYPLYKAQSEDLKFAASCGEFCGYNEILNKDTNFYCKYFKWGLDLLKSQVTTTLKTVSEIPSSLEVNADIAVPAGVGLVAGVSTASSTQKLVTTKASSVTKSTVKAVEQVQGSVSEAQGQTKLQTPSKTELEAAANLDMGDPPIPPIKSSTKKTSPANGDANQSAAIGSLGDVDKNAENQDKALDEALDGESPDDEDEENIDGEVIDNNDKKNTNLLENNNIDLPKNEYTRIDTDEFPEDGDNFFPFFLTAIILVVLLYILYHNKNKVSKVFFGLILEGRSNSRRRNSRGHAYRRLDTLEQAMSANTGAPPSKIIY